MKFCEKCGKEIMDDAVVCPGCGCSVKSEKSQSANTGELNTTGFLVGGIILLAIGIIVGWVFNAWVGIIALLIAEIIFACVRTKIKKSIKATDPSIQKSDIKAKIKEVESANTGAKVCHILTIVAFIILIVYIVLGSITGVI